MVNEKHWFCKLGANSEFIYELHFLPNSKFGKKCKKIAKILVKMYTFYQIFGKKCILITKF